VKADPAAKRETRFNNISQILKGSNLLLALDNFESIFRAVGEKKSDASVLYKFFEDLPARGVTLLISSRESTNLPGERMVEVSGLDMYFGGKLFSEIVRKRRTELDEQSCREASSAVGGHPLAIRLVAPVFDGGEGTTLEEFIANLDATLKTAAKTMADGKRHDTLQTCFDFSLNHFDASAPELVDAIARLSEFTAEFLDWLAAPALFGREKIFESDDSQEQAFKDSARHLHRLYDVGLLEREILAINENDSLTFYSLHPALRPFAADRLTQDSKSSAEDGYFLAMRHLGRTCYPTSKGGGIYAMKMYQQARDILEGLGDLQGKSMTLGMISKVFWEKQSYKDAIASLLSGLMQLVELKIEPQTQQAMASDMAGWRQELGAEKFDGIWKELTDSPIPEWLAQPSQSEQKGMTAEQFIIEAIQAARQKKPEAQHFYEAAGKMAGDPDAPDDLHTLGRVLQRIMIGDTKADLSSLPPELAEIVRKVLQE